MFCPKHIGSLIYYKQIYQSACIGSTALVDFCRGCKSINVQRISLSLYKMLNFYLPRVGEMRKPCDAQQILTNSPVPWGSSLSALVESEQFSRRTALCIQGLYQDFAKVSTASYLSISIQSLSAFELFYCLLIFYRKSFQLKLYLTVILNYVFLVSGVVHI